MQSAKNIIENGLDVTKSGSEQGQARGKGFYTAYSKKLSKEYAKQSIGEYKDVIYEYKGTKVHDTDFQKYEGERGQPAILKVFSKITITETHGFYDKKYYINHGILSSDGDPHGDAKFIKKGLKDDLEMVIRPENYDYIYVKMSGEDSPINSPEWENHEF